jgi:hypothetical protein
MSVICTFRAPGVTPDTYDRIRTYLAWEVDPPRGGMAHYMSFDDDGAVEVDIWETKAGFLDFFNDHLLPACRRFDVNPSRPEIREIYLMAVAPMDEAHMVPRAITPSRTFA